VFADAWERAGRYARHVVTCARYGDGLVTAHGATFLVLDGSGWVVTAGHVFRPPSRNGYMFPVQLERWWGADGVTESDVHVYEDVDLAICRIEPCLAVDGAPSFRRAGSQRLGTSLLTLGYPFGECDARYDGESGEFQFSGGTRGLYGVDGMLSRVIDAGRSDDGYPRRYLETSAAGLIGQSGGPTVDVTGAVWGIQVRTQHEALGFDVAVTVGHGVVTEHQVRNTGLAVQTSTLEPLLERHGIEVSWAG
jgi:S1-C subfamily serine protease